jgi:hypothetical protein
LAPATSTLASGEALFFKWSTFIISIFRDVVCAYMDNQYIDCQTKKKRFASSDNNSPGEIGR